MSLGVLFLLLSSVFAVAQEEPADDSCRGFWGKVNCFFFGSKEARGGRAWWERGEAVVGEAAAAPGAKGWLCEGGQYCSCQNKLGCYDDRDVWFFTGQSKTTSADLNKYYVKSPPSSAYQLLNELREGKIDESHASFIHDLACVEGNYESCTWIDKQEAEQVVVLPAEEIKAKPLQKGGEPAEKAGSEKVSEAAPGGLPSRPFTDDDLSLKKNKELVTQLKGEGVSGQFNKKKGTFTLDSAGQKFFFQEEGGKKVVVLEAELPQTRFGGPVPAPKTYTKDAVALNGLKDELGAYFDRYQIGKADEVLLSDNSYIARKYDQQGNFIGVVRLTKDPDTNIWTGYASLPGKKGGSIEETFLASNGQVFATQTEEQKKQGVILVGKTPYAVGKDKGLEDVKGDLTNEGLLIPGEKDEKGKKVKFTNDVLEETDFQEETQTVRNTKTGETIQRNGNTYSKGDFGCDEKGGCFVPTGGTIFEKNKDGKDVPKYLVDYDYDDSPPFPDKESKLEDIEYFNPATGRQEGTELPDGTTIFAQKDEHGKYNGLYEVNGEAHSIETLSKKDGVTKEVLEKAKEIESSSQGSLATAQTALESIYAVANQVRSYPAISNLLFGKADFYKDWRSAQDKAFAPMLGSNWFPSAICENNDLHWRDIEPQGKAVIKTVSGTYQAVASIQMERSEQSSPILCHKNPDEEADEQWICDRQQVCVDENFCYADKDRDDEPDEEEPLQGNFYKITWAVSAPRDEALTPLVDENGVAVSFNVFIDVVADGSVSPGAIPLYNRIGNIASPMQLTNGESDKDAIIKYSTNPSLQEACIKWNQPPISIGVAGKEGETAVSSGPIGDVCFSVVTSSVGKVNWERAGQASTSVSQNKGEISRNTEW